MDITVSIEDPARQGSLFGAADRNLRLIRSAFGVQISARDGHVYINGAADAAQRAAHAIDQLQRSLRLRPDLSEEVVNDAIRRATAGQSQSGVALDVMLPGVTITPRTPGQRLYVDAILQHDLTLCLGPAGTGKTFLAAAVCISLLKQNRIRRIVLVRPAVEAGEKLGYLPGDVQAKVNPYLRPLFDAMHDMMTYDQIRRAMQNDVIEVLPLAFMRGRTLNQAAIILDEAQNATPGQMLMFLTRLGQGSKMIVTGDDSQSDLAGGEASGLRDAVERLQGIPGVATVRLAQQDIVRHPLVQHVVEAYGRKGEAVR